jgi:hypothetical protein
MSASTEPGPLTASDFEVSLAAFRERLSHPRYRLVDDNPRFVFRNGVARREILRWQESPRMRELIERLNMIELPHGSHGVEHAFRVGAMCMAFHSQLEPLSSEALSYFLMGYLHDVGRLDVAGHADHGPASVERIRRLGFPLAAPFLEAIAAHAQERPPLTPQEACLFDADRLDLVRLGREPDARLLSPQLAAPLGRFVMLARAFVLTRHCCFVPCQMQSRAALEVWLQLDRHLRHLDGGVVFHGSTAHGLPTLVGTERTWPLEGRLLYATRDFLEAYYVGVEACAGRDGLVSVYVLDAGEFDRTLFTVRAVEHAAPAPVTPIFEVRCPADGRPSAFESYFAAIEPDSAAHAALAATRRQLAALGRERAAERRQG